MSEPLEPMDRLRQEFREELRRLEDEFRARNNVLTQAMGYSQGWQTLMQDRMNRLERQLDNLQLLLTGAGPRPPKDNKPPAHAD